MNATTFIRFRDLRALALLTATTLVGSSAYGGVFTTEFEDYLAEVKKAGKELEAEENKKAKERGREESSLVKALTEQEQLMTKTHQERNKLEGELAKLEAAKVKHGQEELAAAKMKEDLRVTYLVNKADLSVDDMRGVLDRIQEEEDKINKARAELAQIKKESEAKTKQLNEANKLHNNYEAAAAKAKGALTAFQQKPSEASAADDKKSEDLKNKYVEAAKKMFDAQQKESYDAKLYLTDMKHQLALRKIDEVQLEALIQAEENRLNGTLLGIHMNRQIRKAMQGVCANLGKCSAENVSELDKLIAEVLDKDEGKLKDINERLSKPTTGEKSAPAASQPAPGADAAPGR